MGSSSSSEDYRQCSERESRRGRAGVCGDPSSRAVLWQISVEDFDSHGALQDDALASFTDGSWGRADSAPALQDSARAFELLESAAVHSYSSPWRKEFTTIKTFSGGYVHVSKGVLSEELSTRSFQKMGYVRRDNHRLMVTTPPPACQSVQVALGCFALRLECEILSEVSTQSGTSVLPAEESLRARRASGDVASCVAWSQQRSAQDEEPPPSPPRGTPATYGAPVDSYQDSQEDESSEASSYGEPSPGSDSPPVESAYRPPLWEQSAKLWGSGGQPWEPPADDMHRASSPPYGASEEESEPEPSAFSFLSSRRESSRSGDLAPPESPSSPRQASPRHRQAEAAASSAYGPAVEPSSYQAHSCLSPGNLPTLCCDTCRQLHATHCTALSACRPTHSSRILLGDNQRRSWSQRAQVDNSLYDSPGAHP